MQQANSNGTTIYVYIHQNLTSQSPNFLFLIYNNNDDDMFKFGHAIFIFFLALNLIRWS